jgi:hypothetical protein
MGSSDEFVSQHAGYPLTSLKPLNVNCCVVGGQMFRNLTCLLIVLLVVNCLGEPKNIDRNGLFPANSTGQ